MQTIEHLKQQRETLLQLADQLQYQIENHPEEIPAKPKIKIELGDFTFYKGHAYFITKDYSDYSGNKAVGVRFNYNYEGVNKFSWIDLIHCDEFAIFTYTEANIKIIPRQDCDLSALGL